ncbi:hypothetical protein C4564_05165 [Candidatus Microgenomates bacterium]|nr:MAG: hypothetical protein C4564_05165 [Candidatus Microgenomates bacterium]
MASRETSEKGIPSYPVPGNSGEKYFTAPGKRRGDTEVFIITGKDNESTWRPDELAEIRGNKKKGRG